MKNGNWRTWLLGIGATLFAALITNGIVFQRETKEDVATLKDQVKHLQTRDENIIKYMQQLSDGEIRRLEQRIDRLERKQ